MGERLRATSGVARRLSADGRHHGTLVVGSVRVQTLLDGLEILLLDRSRRSARDRSPVGLRSAVNSASTCNRPSVSATNCGTISDCHMSANESSRVRQAGGAFAVDGNAPLCQRRAVRSLIPAAAAAAVYLPRRGVHVRFVSAVLCGGVFVVPRSFRSGR